MNISPMDYIREQHIKSSSEAFDRSFTSFIDGFYKNNDDIYRSSISGDIIVHDGANTIVTDDDGCMFIMRNNHDVGDMNIIETEDFKELSRYDIEYPAFLNKVVERTSYHNLIPLFMQLTPKNKKIVPYYKKRAMPYNKYIRYTEDVIEGVKVYSKVHPGYYRKLIYINYEFDCSEFFDFPVFRLSDDVHKVNYNFLSQGALHAKNLLDEGDDLYTEKRDFKDDFYYIGNGRFALITRNESYTRDHMVALNHEFEGDVVSCRYKRKFGVI